VGITELGNKLGIDKGVVSRLVKRGMPTTSVDAANAWREIHAKPRPGRQKGIKKAAEIPVVSDPGTITETPPPVLTRDHSAPEPDEDNNDPRQSLRRARKAELVGYNELVLCKKNGGSVEDIRKANSIYIAARNNRYKAERDFKEWQRQESILLYFDEARDIVTRPHIAVKQTLDIMPKTLAPRLFNQPQKAIEQTLADWVDNLTTLIRGGI